MFVEIKNSFVVAETSSALLQTHYITGDIKCVPEDGLSTGRNM